MFKNITLSQEQIILGGLLGDSYCNRKRQFVRFYHSEKQLEYLLWKYNQFEKEDIRGLYKRNIDNKYFSQNFEFANKKQKMNDLFTFLSKNLYSNEGRKKISLKYLNKLKPLGLAIWWMDDGSLINHKGSRYGRLCTESFNYEEHILLQKYFKQKWDIDVSIKEEKGKYYFLRFNVESLKKLFTIIYKDICHVPSMIYKIDLNYKNNVKLGEYEYVYNYIKKSIFNQKEL